MKSFNEMSIDLPSVPAKPFVPEQITIDRKRIDHVREIDLPMGESNRLILKSDSLTRTCPLDGRRGCGIFQTSIFSDFKSR
jgi:hypothetical protein